ncbi:hypothetical protein LCGC14_2763130, partial [marine sediment metagenome]
MKHKGGKNMEEKKSKKTLIEEKCKKCGINL